jgi:hypothetical protein
MTVRVAHASRRDKNEKELVDFWRSAGCIWIPLQPGQGADGILIGITGTFIVEVKNPEYMWELTKEESMLKIQMEQCGQSYNIVQTLGDAARLIGLDMYPVWDSSQKAGPA